MKKKLGKEWLTKGSVDSTRTLRRKPWEETWTEDDVKGISDGGRCKLASAAPDMARALLEVLTQMHRKEGMEMLRESIEAALLKAGVR
jgi:hypothetical protein